jgi:hypothetical protein
MKQFKDLTIYDTFYCVDDGSTDVKEERFSSMERGCFNTRVKKGSYDNDGLFSLKADELKKCYVRKIGYHNVSVHFFANKNDAYAYAHSNLMNRFNELKSQAYEAIDKVIQFRKQNWEHLNDEYITTEVSILLNRKNQSI